MRKTSVNKVREHIASWVGFAVLCVPVVGAVHHYVVMPHLIEVAEAHANAVRYDMYKEFKKAYDAIPDGQKKPHQKLRLIELTEKAATYKNIADRDYSNGLIEDVPD